MPAKTKQAKPRRDVEAEVTDRIIEALEANSVPWRKPWTSSGLLPTSISTGRAYRGINALLLAMTAEAKGYDSPYWLTFNQAKAHGGSIRKGERATQVVFWKRWETDDKDKQAAGDPDAKKSVFLLRFFSVFNLAQTDGVELPKRFELPEAEALDPIEQAEAIWEGYESGPALRRALSDSAHYEPAADRITLPLEEQFTKAAAGQHANAAHAYYGTLFHEAIHSTGHASRLDRFERSGEPQHFGSERYAREELVAEMGAAMLRSLAGIATDDSTEQSAAYVASWLEALRNDKRLVIQAAAQAQRAVDRIVGTAFENEGAGEDDAAASAA
jgi:antirestriction protein ArdC